MNDNLIKKLAQKIKDCDAIVIGAGAGLSTSAGFIYTGERFERYFSDFIKQYHINDMYTGGFYPYQTLEEYWAYWSRYVYYNRYVQPPQNTYQLLYQLVKDKDYFVLTTNVDHQFQNASFDKQRLFYTQGDYGLWQCSKPCHQQTYNNEEIIKQMVSQQDHMKIPSSLIPYCPQCSAPMIMNLRCDETFVQDAGWYQAQSRYKEFINKHQNKHIIYLELGVGNNTPVIIKYPFWNEVYKNPLATYVCINNGEIQCPLEISKQSLLIKEDIHEVLKEIGAKL